MNVHEIAAAIKALEQKVGLRAEVYFYIRPAGCSSTLYTGGVSAAGGRKVEDFSVHSDKRDPAENLAELESRWVAERAKRNERIIERMALEIIRLTAEFGQCTDAALRAEFGALVAELSGVATARANEMAANGPFEIVTIRSANAA